MIDFAYNVTIPANTPEDTPHKESLKLTKGKLVHVVLTFQSGCAYMVHVTLGTTSRQLLPIVEGQSYVLDNYILERKTAIVLDESPYELIFKGWSPNTAYDHTIGVLCTVETEDDTNALKTLAELLS